MSNDDERASDDGPADESDYGPPQDGAGDGKKAEPGATESVGDGESRERREPAETKYCYECGAVINAKAEICPECGVRQPTAASQDDEARIVAAVLAIVLGGFGAHKFYLGQTGMGVLYLCFFWTFIPSVVGIIEGAIYLSKSDEEFRAQYLDD